MPLKKAPTCYDPFYYSQSVRQLDDGDFFPFIQNKDLTLVMFYDSCDTASLQPARNVGLASKSTKRPDHAFAAVDCSMDKDLCRQNRAEVLPVFKLYARDGLIRTIASYQRYNHDALRDMMETQLV